MTDTKKVLTQNESLYKYKNSSVPNNNKNDIFSQFETNRQILKNNKQSSLNNNTNGSVNNSNNKIGFKNQNKSNINMQVNDYDYGQDYYDDDFEESGKNTNKIKKKNNKNQIQNQIINKNINKNNRLSNSQQQQPIIKQKSKQKNKQNKLTLQKQRQKQRQKQKQKNITIGKYQSQIDKRFNNQDLQSMSNQLMNKNNEQIRQYIKKYNDILTDMINRNLAQFTNSKRKKPQSIQQTIKVLQEQIKNNNKIEQLDNTQLQKLTQYKQKLEQQQNYNQKNFQSQSIDLHNKIKQTKKYIYNLKLAVQNQAKKLIPTNFTASKHQNQSQVTMLKQKILVVRKQFDKNQEKLTNLNQRQYQLTNKVQGLGNIDQQSDNLRSSHKTTQDKNKRYQQAKKKYDNIKGHVTKIQALWNTKCSMIVHENQGIKQKIKNIQLQVKDMQSSVKLTYEKSMKTLNTNKPKNQQNQKVLDKIMGQMSTYHNQGTMNKQMSLSQMKFLTKKKQSSDQVSVHVDNSRANQDKKQLKIKQHQVKTKSQQSQRNRVWKQEQLKQQKKITNTTQVLKIQKSKTQKNSLKIGELQNKKLEQNIQKEVKQQPKQDNQNNNIEKAIENEIKTQNKPKKFNFNRNKANSQLQVEQQNDKDIQKQEEDKKVIQVPQDNKNKSIQQVIKKQPQLNQQKPKQKPKMQPQKQIEQTNIKNQSNVEQNNIDIKPKRFNLNLRDRKSKQQNAGYNPSAETKQTNNQTKQQKIINTIQQSNNQINNSNVNTNNANNKPAFNLKKKKDTDRKLQALDNQFMVQ